MTLGKNCLDDCSPKKKLTVIRLQLRSNGGCEKISNVHQFTGLSDSMLQKISDMSDTMNIYQQLQLHIMYSSSKTNFISHTCRSVS